MTERPGLHTRPSAVLCDMDGLLLDTERLAVDSWQMIFDQNGVHVPRSALLASVGIDEYGTRVLFENAVGTIPDYASLFEQRVNLANRQIDTHGIAAKPGARELLEWCAMEQIPAALVSSTEKARVLHYLDRSGMRSFFAVIICREDTPLGKPDPAPYRAAVNALELAPKTCLILEDSAAGVASGHGAGIPVYCVPDLNPPTDTTRAIADRICVDLHEVLALLKGSA